jgi:hypothetical protein
MSGVEARSRRLRYKVYRRVRDAQLFAQRLGLRDADFGGRLDIANLANHAFFLAYELRAPLPQAVRVRSFTEQEGDDLREIACYHPGLGDAPGEIQINSSHGFWEDPEGMMREAREGHDFSTDDLRHPIAHEPGELARHQSVGGDRFYPWGELYLATEQELQGENMELVYQAVSDRATHNHSEFVAEVFAALLLGREELMQDAELMRLLEKYGGSGVRRYLA